MRARLGRRNDPGLRLDRPRSKQQLPMGPASRHRKRTRVGEYLSPSIDEPASALGEPHVEADLQSEDAGRSGERKTELIAGRSRDGLSQCHLGGLDVEEVQLLVAVRYLPRRRDVDASVAHLMCVPAGLVDARYYRQRVCLRTPA